MSCLNNGAQQRLCAICCREVKTATDEANIPNLKRLNLECSKTWNFWVLRWWPPVEDSTPDLMWQVTLRMHRHLMREPASCVCVYLKHIYGFYVRLGSHPAISHYVMQTIKKKKSETPCILGRNKLTYTNCWQWDGPDEAWVAKPVTSCCHTSEVHPQVPLWPKHKKLTQTPVMAKPPSCTKSSELGKSTQVHRVIKGFAGSVAQGVGRMLA